MGLPPRRSAVRVIVEVHVLGVDHRLASATRRCIPQEVDNLSRSIVAVYIMLQSVMDVVKLEHAKILSDEHFSS